MVDKIGKPALEMPAVKAKIKDQGDPLISFRQVFTDKLKGMPVASDIDPNGKVFLGNSAGLSSVNISKLV